MKTAINIKVLPPIRSGHNSVSVYHCCPYCGYEDWAAVMVGDSARVVECEECNTWYKIEVDE
jgi:transcription elongation factor Elf1